MNSLDIDAIAKEVLEKVKVEPPKPLPKMKLHSYWDKLGLSTKDLEGINLIISKGINETMLYNMMVNCHNRGFLKGKNEVVDVWKNVFGGINL